MYPAIHDYCCSIAKSCPTLCDPMYCSMPGFPVLYYLPKFVQTHVHWVSDAIQPSHLLSSRPLLPPSVFPSIRVFLMSWLFTSGSQSIGVWASASVLPKNIQDWFPLGWTVWISSCSPWTLKSLLQHRSSKASILWLSAFFMVQLSHSYMTTGKTIALTRQTFVGKVMSLLFNMLSRRWL